MRCLILVGTRPEVIKMAPVVKAIEAAGGEAVFGLTGQHKELVAPLLDIFDLDPAFDMDLMSRAGGDLNRISAAILSEAPALIAKHKPDVVLAHGDTTTAMAAGMAAFHLRIPLGHVEAGLRTMDLSQPWPEEMNRRVLDTLSKVMFAPTERAREAILAENPYSRDIHVTGNTVIDALRLAAQRLESDAALRADLDKRFAFLDGSRLVLATAHRRENFGPSAEEICHGLAAVAAEPGVKLVLPMHLNPNIRKPIMEILKDGDAHLIEPQDYLSFLYLMRRAELVLTDSGGLQEEAPYFGKPVLVMRETTERPEAVEAGVAKLVGASRDVIAREARRLLRDETAYQRMATATNPFGDGFAAERIAAALAARYGVESRRRA